MSALKNLQDRLKQVEREKQAAERHVNKLAASAASSTQSAGKSRLFIRNALKLMPSQIR